MLHGSQISRCSRVVGNFLFTGDSSHFLGNDDPEDFIVELPTYKPRRKISIGNVRVTSLCNTHFSKKIIYNFSNENYKLVVLIVLVVPALTSHVSC